MPTIDTKHTKTHYVCRGPDDGTPTWILHGGLEDGRDWTWLADRLGPARRVTLPDRRGHGRTPDVEGAYTYRAAADDTIESLESLESGPVDLVGFSDGAIVALDVASRRPDLVRVVAAISGNADGAQGVHPAFLARLQDPDPENPRLAGIRAHYAEVSPDGDAHWPTFHRKVSAMGARGPELRLADLARVEAPTLIVAADDDVVLLEHAVAMYRALPEGQLAVLPGASHLLAREVPDALVATLTRFLAEPVAERAMPMGGV